MYMGLELKDFLIIIGAAGGISGIITLAKDIYGIRTKILRHPKIRSAIWYLTNKKVNIRISVTKAYSPFEPRVDEVVESVKEKIKAKFGNFIDPPRVGSNYFQFVTEKMSAPIIFTFSLDLDVGTDEPIGVAVQSKVLGNLTFVYREFKMYGDVLKLIEEIYQVIEEVHDLQKPIYANYSVKAATSDTFEEDWSMKKEVRVDDAEIKVGSKIVWANSKTIAPLLDLNKYILMLP